MGLLMKPACERCDAALAPEGDAFLCSHECTFCATCTEQMHGICPNCGGELVKRPRHTQ